MRRGAALASFLPRHHTRQSAAWDGYLVCYILAQKHNPTRVIRRRTQKHSEMSLDGSEAAPTAAHILGDAPTDGAEAQAVTAGAKRHYIHYTSIVKNTLAYAI